jgi:hypothetical protein
LALKLCTLSSVVADWVKVEQVLELVVDPCLQQECNDVHLVHPLDQQELGGLGAQENVQMIYATEN